jgi:hypothetical protein
MSEISVSTASIPQNDDQLTTADYREEEEMKNREREEEAKNRKVREYLDTLPGRPEEVLERDKFYYFADVIFLVSPLTVIM